MKVREIIDIILHSGMFIYVGLKIGNDLASIIIHIKNKIKRK